VKMDERVIPASRDLLRAVQVYLTSTAIGARLRQEPLFVRDAFRRMGEPALRETLHRAGPGERSQGRVARLPSEALQGGCEFTALPVGRLIITLICPRSRRGSFPSTANSSIPVPSAGASLRHRMAAK